MCGIAGIISKNSKLDRSEIITMNGMISHRGPDQNGYLEYKNLLLGHVRLSVIDLSEKGRQPMSNDGRYWIIFNGEIYNFEEIKIQLLKNHKFYSKTDTEVVLNAYKEWGYKCFEKFNGDWIISILDKKTNEIIISRDQVGCKPCYIFENKNKIAFCSEIKGFAGLEEGLNFDNKNFGLLGTTLCSFSKTIFNNITQLPPGRFLKINLETLDKIIVRWFNPLENLPKIHPNYEINQGEYYELLYNATKLRLNADLKIGTSLSGGLDSSVIFMLLNLIQENDRNLDNKKLDLNPVIMNYEDCKTAESAIELAKKYKRKFTLINSSKPDLGNMSDLFSKLEIVEQYLRQPLLYENQKSQGIHISIDGHGADEFLGMPSFLPHMSLQNYNQIVDVNNAVTDYANSEIKNTINKFFGSIADSNELAKYNFIKLLDFKRPLEEYVYKENFMPEGLVVAEDLSLLNNFDLATQYIYFKTYCGFMQWFMGKWDRASMSSAVEVRSPFLDKNIALYSLALPMNKKIKNGKIKSILRDSMSSLLPESIINQKFKQGLSEYKTDPNQKNYLDMIEKIITEKNFIEQNCWDSKKIRDDFASQKNIYLIWQIVKHYLMLNGFNIRLTNVKNTYNKDFRGPNNLRIT